MISVNVCYLSGNSLWLVKLELYIHVVGSKLSYCPDCDVALRRVRVRTWFAFDEDDWVVQSCVIVRNHESTAEHYFHQACVVHLLDVCIEFSWHFVFNDSLLARLQFDCSCVHCAHVYSWCVVLEIDCTVTFISRIVLLFNLCVDIDLEVVYCCHGLYVIICHFHTYQEHPHIIDRWTDCEIGVFAWNEPRRCAPVNAHHWGCVVSVLVSKWRETEILSGSSLHADVCQGIWEFRRSLISFRINLYWYVQVAFHIIEWCCYHYCEWSSILIWRWVKGQSFGGGIQVESYHNWWQSGCCVV